MLLLHTPFWYSFKQILILECSEFYPDASQRVKDFYTFDKSPPSLPQLLATITMYEFVAIFTIICNIVLSDPQRWQLYFLLSQRVANNQPLFMD